MGRDSLRDSLESWLDDSADERVEDDGSELSDGCASGSSAVSIGCASAQKAHEASGLSVDLFCRLFRVDVVTASSADKVAAIVRSLEKRWYSPGQVMVRQGDAVAANELLIFVEGQVKVQSVSQRVQSDAPDGAPPHVDEHVLQAPFFIGEERVLRGSWPTATFSAGTEACKCVVVTEGAIHMLNRTGLFNLERTLRLRAFERTLGKHGMHVSVLRDSVFVEHFLAFLLRLYSAEDLRFLVDVMRFKRDVDNRDAFDVVSARFLPLWDAYLRPWDTMSNVCAIDCPAELLEHVKAAKDRAMAGKNARQLAVVLDPVAKRVKRRIETHMLPAFVKSPCYPGFLRERFPIVEKESKAGASGSVQLAFVPKVRKGGAMETDSTASTGSRAGRSMSVVRRIWSWPQGRSPAETAATCSDAASTHGRLSTKGPGARPALQAKLAIMSEELNEIERTGQPGGPGARRRSTRIDPRRRSHDGGVFARDPGDLSRLKESSKLPGSTDEATDTDRSSPLSLCVLS